MPAPFTALVGRAAERAELVELLSDPLHRLVTLLGLGGAGKTHLALAVAPELALAFEHGAAFVPVGSLASADNLAQAILQSLEVPLPGELDAGQVLVEYLRPRELLLILDSFEHLLPAAAVSDGPLPSAPAQLAALLEQAPRVTVLVTSRERLAMRSEWVLTLSGLACPTAAEPFAPGGEPYAAVQLFMERAQDRKSVV